MRKKRQIAVGGLFWIPLINGKFVLGQVLDEWFTGVVSIAIFDLVFDSTTEPEKIPLSVENVISITSVARREIDGGYWKDAGIASTKIGIPLGSNTNQSNKAFIGRIWHSGTIIEDFVNAYFGLSSWTPYAKDTDLLKSLVIKIVRSRLAA